MNFPIVIIILGQTQQKTTTVPLAGFEWVGNSTTQLGTHTHAQASKVLINACVRAKMHLEYGIIIPDEAADNF